MIIIANWPASNCQNKEKESYSSKLILGDLETAIKRNGDSAMLPLRSYLPKIWKLSV